MVSNRLPAIPAASYIVMVGAVLFTRHIYLSCIYFIASSLIHTDTDSSFTKNLPHPFESITTFSWRPPHISIKVFPACFFPISMLLSPADPLVMSTAQPDNLFFPSPSLVHPMVF